MQSDANRTLKKAFMAIQTMCERLSLPETVKDRAEEVYRDIYELGAIKNRNPTAVYAACVFLACRQEGVPRTFKEVTPVATDTNKVEIWRVFKAITQKLDIKQNQMGVVNAKDFVERWSNLLNLPPNVHKAVKEVAEVACPSDTSIHRPWHNRVPQSIAASVLYLTAAAGRQTLSVDEISRYTGVAAGTIRDTYDEMRPSAADLVPTWLRPAAELEAALPSKAL